MEPRTLGTRFGERLVESGKISQANLDRALGLQRDEPGLRLGELLARLGLIGNEDIAATLAAQFGLSLVAGDSYPEFPVLEEAASVRFLREARALPIAENAERVLIATCDPANDGVVEAFRVLTGRRVDLAVAVKDDFDAAFERLYGAGRTAMDQIVEDYGTAEAHDLNDDVQHLKDLASEAPNPILERLLKDTLRLQLQLENSLFLVNLRSGQLLSEALQVSRIVESLRFHWPDVALKLIGDGAVWADIRALESVLTNLVQNAVIHGQAELVTITVRPIGGDRLQILVADDGHGFHGDFSRLGSLFTRHTKSSGSGVGLYISRQLVKRMGGALTFAPGAAGGFVAALSLPQPAPGSLSARARQVAT